MSSYQFQILFCCCLICGCSSTKQSNTARTAREQMLISNAVDQSLAKIDFSSLNGQKVYLEEKYLDCTDKGYIVGSVRHRSMYNGAHMVAKPEDADIVVELRSGGVGTDMADSYVGIPAIVLPGMLTLPEVKFITHTNQSAVAKIGLVAYDAKTQEVLGSGGVTASMSDDSNWYVMGMGPYQNGTLKYDMKRSLSPDPRQKSQGLPNYVAFNPPAGKAGGEAAPLQLTNDEKVESK
ncbi:MAG: DUF6655 family protein [Planctomycetaceae bacterium]